MKKYQICTTIREDHAKFLKEEGRKVTDVLDDAIDRLIKLKEGATDEEKSPEELKRAIGFLQKRISDMNTTIEEFMIKGTK